MKTSPPNPETVAMIERYAVIGERLAVMGRGGKRLEAMASFLADELAEQIDAAFPERVKVQQERANTVQEKLQRLMEVRGPGLWRMIHGRPHSGLVRSAAEEREWLLATIKPQIPCPACGRHFAAMVEGAKDEVFATPESYFATTVDWHNIVNTSKRNPSPVLTLAEAREQWLSS